MSSPIKLARELRKNQTPEEKILWNALRAQRFKGYKFRRQHPIIYRHVLNEKQFFIADFCCAEKKLIIELDGVHHHLKENKQFDKMRDETLKEMGYAILRIENDEMKDLELVLQKIDIALNSL